MTTDRCWVLGCILFVLCSLVSCQDQLYSVGSRFAESINAALLADYSQYAYYPCNSLCGIEALKHTELEFEFSSSEYVPNDESIVCVPFAASAIAFVYNIPTLYYDTVLNLTPDIILGIFNGTITKWNDPRIEKENMFEYLPDATIVPIYRYGETGTTYLLTSYLSSISTEWTRVHGNATYSSDIFKMLPHYNDTVTYAEQMAKLEDIPNSITYIGYGYTKMHYTYNIANVKDITGQISLPIQSSTMRKAYAGNNVNDRSATALFNKPGAYPIVGYSNWCFLRNQSSATALEMWRFFEKAYMGGISLTGSSNGFIEIPYALRDNIMTELKCVLLGNGCVSPPIFPWWAYLLVSLLLAAVLIVIVLIIYNIVTRTRSKHEASALRELFLSRSVKYNFDINELELEQIIEKKSYGDVYKGRLHGIDVAVKRFIMGKKDVHKFTAECSILEQMRHPNIIQYITSAVHDPYLYLVTEFCHQGDLQSLLLDDSVYLSTSQKIQFALDIARGVLYLHKMTPPIIHCDLKNSNCLVDRNYSVKVADFGLSRAKDDDQSSSVAGTSHTCAPEVITKNRYSEKSDVYSYGIMLWEIFTRLPVYHDKTIHEIMEQVVQGLRPSTDIIEFNDVPNAIKILMEQCWDTKVSNRPSFADIVHTLEGVSNNLQSTPGPNLNESREWLEQDPLL